MSEPKNIPERIFLNIGSKTPPEDFDELGEVTWSKERINEFDIEYTLSDNMNWAKEIAEKMANLSKEKQELVFEFMEFLIQKNKRK